MSDDSAHPGRRINAPQQRATNVRPRKRLLTPAASVVDAFLTARKMTSKVFQTRVFTTFHTLVGEATRKHAKAFRLRGSELTVAVDSASWRQQLSFMVEELRVQLNAKMGKEVISVIRLVHGDISKMEEDEAPPPPPEPLRLALPEELTAADTLVRSVGDGDLATAIAMAYLSAKRSGRT